MLKLNADFQYKDSTILAKKCVVEKTIPLSGKEFDVFSKNLLRDWDFIKENVGLMHFDENGVYHCLLVTGESREDGILVQSEGYNYARYSAHVPHVHSIIAMDRYPSLAGLTNKLIAMADHMVDEAMKSQSGDGCAVVNMDTLEEMSGIYVACNPEIVYTLSKMLSDRPEIDDWEIGGNKFIVTHGVPEMEQEQELAQKLEM